MVYLVLGHIDYILRLPLSGESYYIRGTAIATLLLMRAISSYAACTNNVLSGPATPITPFAQMSSPSPNHAIILQRNWSGRKGENQESGCLATVQTVLSAHWDNAREIRWLGSSECRMKAPWKYSVIPATLDSTYIMCLLMEANTKSAWLCHGHRNVSL